MAQKPIFLSLAHPSGQEQAYIQRAFDANWLTTAGQNLDEFEAAIGAYTGARAVLATSSGTAALHLALRLAGVQAGDVVICPSFTFAATANPICYLGASPFFVDSEADTWNISPDLLITALHQLRAARKKVAAIIVVDLYGNPAQWDAIRQIARHAQLPLIEDAAEALGGSYRQQALGTLGDYGILSFNGNKIITTSGGGALLCPDTDSRTRALHLATQAKDPAPHYQHSTIGYNYRLSNVLAGIGIGQMQVLEERVAARRAIWAYYAQTLPEHTFCPEEGSNCWLSCILLDDEAQRERVRLALAADQIESRPLWKPLHLQPAFAHYGYVGAGIAEGLFARGLCLPSGSTLTPDDLARVVGVIKKIL